MGALTPKAKVQGHRNVGVCGVCERRLLQRWDVQSGQAVEAPASVGLVNAVKSSVRLGHSRFRV